jgi:phosphoenolpyruvate---glycerone phosphotransferase subunit DhaL
MISTVGLLEWSGMLKGAIAEVKAEHAHLSELDSACGDGDHGTTMLRAANLLDKCIGQTTGKGLEGLLGEVAWTLLGLDGGATGPLLGSFFLGISESLGGRNDLDVHGLADAFEAGMQALIRQSRAQVGDKTMLDALVPAVQAMHRAADDGQTVEDALRGAAVAAQDGAARTKDLVAKRGRAKYLGEKTLGVPDPGATSVSLLFRGFYEGLKKFEP